MYAIRSYYEVAELGAGYTYLLSRAGVTGAETRAGKPVGPLLRITSYNVCYTKLLRVPHFVPRQKKSTKKGAMNCS